MRNRIVMVDILTRKFKSVYYKQYDENNELNIVVYKGKTLANISNYAATVYFELPSGKVYEVDGVIENNAIKVILSSSILEEYGQVNVECKLSNLDEVTTTFTFYLNVEKSINRVGTLNPDVQPPQQTYHTHSNLDVLNQITQEMVDSIGLSGGLVDLSIYQTKKDTTLKTDNKTISGAINELNDKVGNISENIDLSDYALKSEIPTVPTKVSQLENDKDYLTEVPEEYITETELTNKGFATESFVTNKISESQLSDEQAQQLNVAYTHSQTPHVQQSDIPTKTSQLTNDSDFATNASVDEKIANVSTGGSVDLTSYAKKTDLPTKTSQLTNDSGFITNIPSEYVTESELNTELSTKANKSEIPSLNGYATESFVTNKIAEASLSGGEVDLSGYATKDELNTKANQSDIPTKTSQLTNDSGFITSVPSEYITESELNAKGYLTEHQDISNKADKSEIPTKTSQLTNDSNFISSIPSEYVTETELSAKGFITSVPSEYITESELNAKGYLTQHQDISGKADKSEIPTKTSQLINDSDFAIKTYVDDEISKIELTPGPQGEQGVKGADGLTTSVVVNGSTFVHQNGIITLPDYPLKDKKFSALMTKAEYDAITDKDPNTIYLVEDEEENVIVGLPNYTTNDADKILAVNVQGTALAWVNKPEIPTTTSQLTNDSDFATNASVDEKIANINTGGTVPISQVEPLDDDIPKVFFNGNKPTTKDDVDATIEYISKTKRFKAYVKIKCQGTSSMSYPKKNYTIKIFSDETRETKLKQNFKGWGKQNKFCLKANYIDHSHARNICSAKLWSEIVGSRSNYEALPELLRTSPKNGAIDGFPIKVYYNNIYEGLYTWNIPKDKWMFNMDDSLDNHCVLCGEEYNSGCFRSANASLWSDEIHDVMPESIKTSFNNFITFVMNSSDIDFKANLENYVYIDSLIDYYIFQYLICGLDSMGKNQLFATYDGTKWIATSYDMDSTFGLYWNGQSFVSAQYRMQEDYESMTNGRAGNLLYVRLEQLFPNEIRARYNELRNSVLSYTNVVNTFERFMDIPGKDLYAEDGTIYTGIPSQATNNIQQIRNYYRDRLTYVDAEIASIGASIACESITLNKTELNMGIFSSEGTEGGETGEVVDDSNTNYIANATWSVGELDGSGGISTSGSSTSCRYCKLTNLPIGEYTLHHDRYNYKKVCIKAYDENNNKNVLKTTDMSNSGATTDMKFKINCPNTVVYISLASNGSEDFSGVTLKRQNLSTSTIQNKTLSPSIAGRPGWAGVTSTSNLIELQIGSTTEITDITEIRTVSIGNDTYNVAWSQNGVGTVEVVEKYPSKCIANTPYANKWCIIMNLPASKYGTTVDSFKTYCTNNGITEIILNSSNVSSGGSSGSTELLTYTLTATVTPTNTTDAVVWSVSPEGICTVKNGVVTAKADGECTITATCGSQSATCTVNVSGMTEEQPVGDDILFELSEPIIGDGTEFTPYIDTNIQLMSEENINNNWTILVDCMGNTDGQNTVAHCIWEEVGYPGISIDYTQNNLRVVVPNNRPIIIQGNALNVKTGVAIVKNGNTFTIYDKLGNVKNTAEVTPITHNSTLVIGAYKTTDGHYGRYLNGEISRFRLSSEAYTTNQIIEYFNPGESDLPLNELVYELNEPQVLDGSSKYVDTHIPLCSTNIDYTIFMNFKMNVVSPTKAAILHCMTEQPPYPGISLQVSRDSINVSGANIVTTMTNVNNDTSRAYLLSSQTTEEQPFVLRKQGNTIELISKVGKASSVYNHNATIKNLLLGAYQDVNGNKGRYANITINQAKVWTRAITDEEIAVELGGTSDEPQDSILTALNEAMTVNLTGLGTSVIDEGNVGKRWTVNATSLTWDSSLGAFDFGKSTGNSIYTENYNPNINFTIDFDVYIDGAPGVNWTFLFAIANATDQPGFGLGINGTNTWNPAVDGNGTPTYTEDNFTGRWIHITATKSSTEGVVIYQDNTSVYTKVTGTNSVSSYSRFVIGNNAALAKSFDGKIANFKVFNKVVSEEERTYLYNHGKSAPSA